MDSQAQIVGEKPNPDNRLHGQKNTANPNSLRRRSVVFSIAVLVMTVAAVTALWWFTSHSSQLTHTTPLSVRELVDENTSTTTQTPTIDPSKFESEVSSEAGDVGRSDQMETLMGSEILEILDTIRNDNQQTKDAMLYFDERMETLLTRMASIESVFTSQLVESDELENRVVQIQNDLESIRSSFKSTQGNRDDRIDTSPPFSLIAVDRWDNEWNAVIELDGRIATIQPRDHRAGWKLKQIDPNRKVAVFQSNTGQTATLEIE